jgi:hypothetical protein
VSPISVDGIGRDPFLLDLTGLWSWLRVWVDASDNAKRGVGQL